MLDVFRADAFNTVSLTRSVNLMPFVPSRAGIVAGWEEEGVTTRTIAIEEENGELKLIDPQPVGSSGVPIVKEQDKIRDLRIPHYPIVDAILASEVSGVRATGSETEVQTVMSRVESRMSKHVRLRLDPTLEYQRVGALKGIILNASGSVLYNLFTEFNVSQLPEIDFDLDNVSPVSGALRKKCTEVSRAISARLGGVPNTGVYCFASDTFWDDLTAHSEFRASYLNQTEAPRLRDGLAYGMVEFGGITFENYRGSVGGTPFIAPDKAHFFPVGVPGLFRTVFAPADYNETVNTVGLPRYVKLEPMAFDKGMAMEMQANALSFCTRPATLIQARRT